MKTIKFVQYGCGKMGKNTAKFAMEKGAELLAVFDGNPDYIGKDAGEVLGREKMGVYVYDPEEADSFMREKKPDICIVTTRSLMSEVKDALLVCAKNGVNAITSCEEAFFPWNSSPAITEEIDRIAKKNNCTITGTGANETQYGGIFALFGGSTHKTEKIHAMALYNVDDYGIALAKGHGVGLTAEEFEKEIAAADNISDEARQELIRKGEFLPSYVWNTNGWLADYLGLTVKSQIQKCVPKFADIDIKSETLGEVIPAGKAIGMGATCITETEEGLTIEAECVGIVYGQGEVDSNTSFSWGVPDLDVKVSQPATVELTCGTIVNRVPDVINAPAGFVTTSRMPILKYRTGNLGEYVK